MIPIALALLMGVAMFPVALVFGPVHFPWSLFVFASLGGVIGLSLAARAFRWRSLQALGLSVLTVAVVVGAFTLTSGAVIGFGVLLRAIPWIGPLLLPVLLGVLAGASLRASMGLVRGAGVAAASAIAIALIGVGLAFALAPAETAEAPRCAAEFDCPRTLCAYMAERRRLLAVERVTAFDGEHITCTYTAWGGLPIGKAEVGPRGGSWTDGAWPEFVTGRRP